MVYDMNYYLAMPVMVDNTRNKLNNTEFYA